MESQTQQTEQQQEQQEMCLYSPRDIVLLYLGDFAPTSSLPNISEVVDRIKEKLHYWIERGKVTIHVNKDRNEARIYTEPLYGQISCHTANYVRVRYVDKDVILLDYGSPLRSLSIPVERITYGGDLRWMPLIAHHWGDVYITPLYSCLR